MLSKLFPEEPGFVRLVEAALAAAATAVGLAVALGLEMSVREGIAWARVGGYLSMPVWTLFVSLWGFLGGGLGIVTGAFAHPRRAFGLGLAAGAAPMALVWIVTLGDSRVPPHPPGLLVVALQFLLSALPGGVGAHLMSGGHRGTA